MIPPPPPPLENLPYGTVLNAGMGQSTIIADFDFETYSPAGYRWDPIKSKWRALPGMEAKNRGLKGVGTAVYSEHPGAEVLCMAYNLKDGNGPQFWIPGEPNPQPLFDHIAAGLLIEAWNASFEFWIWNNVCRPKYGWPVLPLRQLRCAAAKARAHALPGHLGAAGDVLKLHVRKDSDGRRLIDKFSKPRNPSKDDPRLRIKPSEDEDDAQNLYRYCLQDIATEAEASSKIPDLSPFEQEFWFCDQAINQRGIQIDQENIKKCIAIVQQAHHKYNAEMCTITRGEVANANQVGRLKKWLGARGHHFKSLNVKIISAYLKKSSLPPDVKRVLEIRDSIGSAAVKKLYSMTHQMASTGRLHNLFIYHSARTGRAAGVGPQPQNLRKGGPAVARCNGCNRHYGVGRVCPWCCDPAATFKIVEWKAAVVEDALETIATGDLTCVELFFGSDAIAIVAGCIRGLFIAAPGHDLICSDYDSIEARVLAMLAGEQWRIDVFRTHGKIYEMSTSKITGIPFEEFAKYKAENDGSHHPARQTVGKVAELASGYGGSLGAWINFGASEFFTDDQITHAVKTWRAANPAIVALWGGQKCRKTWTQHYHGLEGASIQAVINPGLPVSCQGIQFLSQGNVLYGQAPGGGFITYHQPKLGPGKFDGYELSFEGWNTNPVGGQPQAWIRIPTYGGKLTENFVQKIARDILANAIVNLERAGYPVVLHVHDEIVVEVPEGHGSVEEVERIMATMPGWAADWPITASGGWRGKRYRKG